MDQRRERLLTQGRCFEIGCESTEHVFDDCPKRRKRLQKRKAEIEAKGGTWYDDPKEAKRHKEERKKAQGVKKTYVQAVARESLSSPVRDEDLVRDVLEDDLVDGLIFDDEDEEKYLSSFCTRRILMAKLYDISEEIHHVHFTNQEGSFDEAIV